MKTDREAFLKGLLVLAEMCDKTLSKEMIAMYDAELAEVGYARLASAIRTVIRTRKSRDGFPSISELAQAAGAVKDAQSEGDEAANRIVQAISDFGWSSPASAREFIGELGWLVVQRAGGWESVCDVTVKQVPFVRKQYADMAKMLYNRAEQGKLGQAPALPAPGASGAVAKLTGGIGKAVPTDG